MLIKSMLAALAASFAAVSGVDANIITVTGNTLGGPTFNRPLEDLSALSGVGTDVSYNAFKISASTSGDYTFVMTGGFDTFGLLYGSSFNPTTPLANALIGNDDLIVPPFTTSGFAATLTANTDYFYVTTGFGNADFGTFSSTIGGVGTISATPVVVGSPATSNITTLTGSTAGGPMFNRPLEDLSDLSAVGTDVLYDTFAFTVGAAGDYTFVTTGAFDTFGLLYDSSFNPTIPLANALIASDDLLVSPFTTSGFAATLATNTNYFYVTTGFGNTDFGEFSTTIAGPGAISSPGAGSVPEPATLALLAFGLAGIGFSRRKQ